MWIHYFIAKKTINQVAQICKEMTVPFYLSRNHFCPSPLQDVLENDDIKLDWMFKSSLISDMCNVSILNLIVICMYIMEFIYITQETYFHIP